MESWYKAVFVDHVRKKVLPVGDITLVRMLLHSTPKDWRGSLEIYSEGPAGRTDAVLGEFDGTSWVFAYRDDILEMLLNLGWNVSSRFNGAWKTVFGVGVAGA